MSDIQIKTSYFICFTPRTGSTLLCECLAKTGVAGSPAEHFYHGNSPDNPEGETVPDYKDYIQQVIQSTTSSNGVFGTKLHDANDFAQRLATIPQYSQSHPQTAIKALFPNPHYIWLTRRNKVRQAVSHWMAIQSGRWHAPNEPTQSQPQYRYEAIDHLVQDIMIREAGWQAFFTSANIRPFVVVYEDFIADLKSTTRDILDYCGIEATAQLNFEDMKNQRLANQQSEEWVQQYRKQKQDGWWTQFW